ncbi:MAG: DUF1365 domain-containing protein [Halioglobus sp.]|nr:DUF1365 domain-containing protein [Halioglobus sp.]
MKSRIYEGIVRHRRHGPRSHQFSYRVAMPWLCLDEIPALFDAGRLWSARGPAPGEFRRSDFLGDPAVPLADAVRRRIFEETGAVHTGPIYLLANLRYFGFIMNPIACYYCYSDDGTRLEYLVAEVTNTPWKERHSYVLPGPGEGKMLRAEFDKAMHVSPFNPMDMRYRWRSNSPDRRLLLHMENRQGDTTVFDATLALSAREMTAGNLNRLLLRYPWMTAKVGIAIYWEAMKLFLKGVPVHAHPRRRAIGASHE